MEKDKGMKKEGGKEAGRKVGVVRFLITYLLMMGAFFFLIGYKPIQQILDINGVYTDMIIFFTEKVLVLVGIIATHQGTIIHLPGISLDIKFGCNGLEAVMIFSVAVVAFPAGWRKKLAGILVGFLIIQVLNIFRIAVLAYTGVKHPKIFDLIHIYVAQGVMIVVALGVFLLYLNYATRPAQKPA